MGFESAIIIASTIHQMIKKDRFKNMTLTKLLLTLAKLKMTTVSGKVILQTLTKVQTKIFQAFGISLPDYDTLKLKQQKKLSMKPTAAVEGR